MKNKLDDRLKLELINNEITNTNDILASLPYIYDYEMLKEYYEFMVSNISISLYKDLDKILNAIKERTKTLETGIKIEEELNKLKSRDIGFKEISIIENKRIDNDVFRDKYYLKYKNPNGSLTIFEIQNIDNLLYLLITTGKTMKAYDFVIYLKRHFRELPTYGLGKHEINVLEEENSSMIPDKSNYKVEKKILENDYPDIIPKVSIDSNQERLYHINNLVIKFHDEHGLRQKSIISKNDGIKNLDSINPDFSEQENEKLSDENNIIINRNELDDIEFDLNEIIPIVHNYVRGFSLEKTYQLKLYAFLLDTLSKMEAKQDIKEEEPYLDAAINYIRTVTPNNIEQEILNRYEVYYLKQEQNEKSSSVSHSKKYTNPNYPTSPLIIDNNGVSLTIIVITTTILLGALLAALLLVK